MTSRTHWILGITSMTAFGLVGSVTSQTSRLIHSLRGDVLLCCAQTAQAVTLTRRRRFRNGAKTHRQVSDATAMMRPMMNIRPAVSGVMNYLVYVANLRVLVRNQIGHCWLARSPPRSQASLPDRTFKIK